jgi:hypothetical protein
MMDPGSLPGILADIAGAGMVAAGALGFFFPGSGAQSFGLPTEDRNGLGFVRATAVRDVALGAVTLAASLRGAGDVLLVAVCCGLAISLLDFLNAFYTGGRELHRQHVVHVAGAALFAAVLALLLQQVR